MAAVKRGDGKPLTTKAGTRLDAEVEKRLADEAEAGFDPATLTRRRLTFPRLELEG